MHINDDERAAGKTASIGTQPRERSIRSAQAFGSAEGLPLRFRTTGGEKLERDRRVDEEVQIVGDLGSWGDRGLGGMEVAGVGELEALGDGGIVGEAF